MNRKMITAICIIYYAGMLYADPNSDLISHSRSGNVTEVKNTLNRGADINAKDNEGGTALIYASYYGKSEIVKYLLKAGADVNTRNRQGKTALMQIDYSKRKMLIKLLRKAGAKGGAHTIRHGAGR